MNSIYSCLVLVLLFSCEAKNNKEKSATPDGGTISQAKKLEALPYQLNTPQETYRLPGSLVELSGMQSIDDKLIACLQDEDGVIYLFDREQQKVVREISWGPGGDYEGIAGDSQDLYVLKSDGTIFKVSNYNSSPALTVRKWKTKPEKSCDAEGLFLMDGAVLLLACKGGKDNLRNIWAFDLEKERLQERPFLQISLAALENAVLSSSLDRFSLGVKKLLDPKGESGILAPSGIAIHPHTKDLYIISAASKLLVVFTAAGELKNITALPASIFIHPESITFTPAGDLLIGNEGKGAEASILFFKYDKI